jgi:hypothetical protein
MRGQASRIDGRQTLVIARAHFFWHVNLHVEPMLVILTGLFHFACWEAVEMGGPTQEGRVGT